MNTSRPIRLRQALLSFPIGLLFLLGSVMCPSSSWAWGDLGHKIICQIAFEELNDKARNEVTRLIALDPTFNSFTDACTWPDHPRKRAEEHFINVGRSVHTITVAQCPAVPKCLFTAIPVDLEVLRASNDDAAKLASLKFLGHWIGDIHQPLHVSFAFAYDVALFFAEDWKEIGRKPMPECGAIYALPIDAINRYSLLVTLPKAVMRPNLQFGKFLRGIPTVCLLLSSAITSFVTATLLGLSPEVSPRSALSRRPSSSNISSPLRIHFRRLLESFGPGELVPMASEEEASWKQDPRSAIRRIMLGCSNSSTVAFRSLEAG